MPHSIFVREYAGTKARQPSLLAYEISGLQEAEQIVQSIAASYPEHGIAAGTKIHWFRHAGRIHEIYAWPS